MTKDIIIGMSCAGLVVDGVVIDTESEGPSLDMGRG